MSANDIAERQPAKLAALEAHYETKKNVPLYIGGIVYEENRTVDYKIEILGALSFLPFGDFDAEVKSLNDFPEDEQPPFAITHYTFKIVVGLGTLLVLAGIIYFISLCRKKRQKNKRYWLFFTLLSPLGFIALEAG